MAAKRPPRPMIAEVARIERDIYADYIGRTLLNPDKLLRTEGNGKGLELYEETMMDPQVRSTLQTRKLAVVCKEWEVVPATDKLKDRKVAEFVEQVLQGFGYDAARSVLLSGLVLGFKPAEIIWEYSEGSVWVKEMIGRASRRFVFDLDRSMRLLTTANMVEGEALPARKFVIYRNVSDNGSPYGDPLGKSLYWPAWFKKNAVKFWMIFSDKFGMPTVVGKYPAGTTSDDVTKLLDAISAIQTDAAIALPDTMVAELIESARAGTMNTYESLCNFMNAEISKILLGQTLTTEMSQKGGSFAASKTHNDVREDYIKADADSLCECQNNSLVKWIVDFNFPAVTQYPKVWIRTDPEADLLALAQRDKILAVDIKGLKIPASYFYETYAIPEPQGDEEVVCGAPEQPQTPFQVEIPRTTTGTKKGGSAESNEQEPETEESFAEGSGGLFPDQTALDKVPGPNAKALQQTLRPVLDLINQGHSYAEIEQHLYDQYPKMKTAEIEKLMERAIFVSEVWGRLNA